MKKFLGIAFLLAIVAGVSYGLYMDWRLRKVLRTADSLQVVTDSLKRQSDSLVHLSRQQDTVFVDRVISHLITKWDTVRIDSILYVPVAQADSVKLQRDQCIVVWSACRAARDKAEESRDAAVATNTKLREYIARDSIKDHAPHLNLSGVAGVGTVMPFWDNKVVAGPGLLVGLRVWNLRIF